MPRIIFKCPYIKPGTEKAAVHLNNYVRYVATRDGVEKLTPDKAGLPATKKQQAMVERLLRDFPMCCGMFEYEDYQSSPTRAAASEFITRAIEDNYDQVAKRENYVSYIAQRPRAERVGSHGLFSGTDDPLALSRIAEEVANHPGNVWLPIISLRREDAARLGYDNAERWRTFLRSYAMELAEAMKIPWNQFRWYAAFHDEGHHPHVHMVCYSADGNSGFLTKVGIAHIKSGLAKEIFRQDLTEIYQRQTQRRDELVRESGKVMKELIQQMRSSTLENPRIEQLTGELAQRLKSTSGKKQYGYLKAPVKAIIDEIVDELAKDSRVASAYDLWYQLREDVLRTYKTGSPPEPSASGSGGERRSSGMSEPCRLRLGERYEACDDALSDRLPLSRQTEFRRIKNLVVGEAVRLGEHTEVSTPADTQELSQAGENAGPEPEAEPMDTPEVSGEAPPAVVWSARYKQARTFLYGDDDTPQDHKAAYKLFMKEAVSGNALAMYDLGRMFVDGIGVDADADQAQIWYAKALSAFQTVERQRPNRYVEYRIGWMLLHGMGTERDESAALEWLEKSAELKNPHAEYLLAKHILADSAAAPERINQAIDWLTQAAEAGLSYAQYALGKLYRDGGPVDQDTTQAVIWFSQAAEQGNQYAMYALGKLHQEIKNFPAALHWFQQSAGLGNQYAQYQLGKLLLTGDGVAKDTAGAVRWLTESAEQGNQYAQYALGKLYLLGKNVPQDREAAVRWFTLAAEQGNEYAQFFLDHMDNSPSLFVSATRLLHHMGRVFQDQAPPPSGGISFVDSKLRRKIREKKIAMGHKPDDHEEPTQQLR